MIPPFAEARRVVREQLRWAAAQGLWPPDVLAAMGWRRPAAITWGEAEAILAVEWLRLVERSASGRDAPVRVALAPAERRAA